MKSTKIFIAVIVVAVISGCAPQTTTTRLTVDFQQNQPLKYKLVSSRRIKVDWGESSGMKESDRVMESSETLNLVISYTPVEVDQYGTTTIQAACETAGVGRDSRISRRESQPDAAESFAGKTWTFTVGPTGKMEDRSKLYDVIRQAGQKAFRAQRNRDGSAIKDPDMLYDFIASQWFLWDSISSIKNPLEGVRVGDQWKSLLSVPAPMFLFAARDVNYRLEEIRQEPNDGRVAVIASTFTLLYPNPPEWPVPYTEVFQMSGTYGFLRGYKTSDLRGQGQEFFNIDAGRIEKYSHKYTIHVSASLLLPGVNPQITIDQTLTMDLLEPKPLRIEPAPAKK